MDDRDMQGCTCSSGQEDSQAFVHRRYRVEMPSLDPSLSISSFDEVEKGLTEEMAVAEAMRCLGCRVGLCVGCSICAEICPDACISIETAKSASGKEYVTDYSISSANCMFCGLCQEACPTGTLSHTGEYELAAYRKSDLVYRMKESEER